MSTTTAAVAAAAPPLPTPSHGGKGRNNERGERGGHSNSSRLQKPNKEDLDKLSNDIQTQINLLQNESKDIKKQIDKVLGARTGSKSEFDTAKALLQQLITERKQLLDEKTALSTSRDAARDKINLKINEEKTTRTELKFHNIESIDSQIRELEARQARTTMSLQDEKKILKDIHNLQMSKKVVNNLIEMKNGIELLKQQKILIDQQFHEKSNQVKLVNDRITSQRAVLEGLSKENTRDREVIPTLKLRQNDIKKEIEEKINEIKLAKQEFKVKEDAYYLALAEERQRKKELKQKEIEAKKLAEEARKKAEEEEELKRIPYEEEMNLCDYLVSYLETLLPSQSTTSLSSTVTDTTSTSSSTPTTSTSGNFDGMKVLVRTEEEFSTVAVQKKKGKKKNGNSQRDIISHGVDTLESFSLLEITPPNNVTNIPTAIEALKAKKLNFQGLERGAVETLASKLRAEREKKSSDESKKRNKSSSSGFNLERDFPDLVIASPTTETC